MMKITIVKFEDGTFFNGVKGRVVRYSNNFKDAKIIDGGKLSERDLGFLSTRNSLGYEIINVELTMKIIK